MFIVHISLERGTGLEPATSSLGRKHSTTELPPHTVYGITNTCPGKMRACWPLSK